LVFLSNTWTMATYLKLFYGTFLLSLLCSPVMAQQDAIASQYHLNPAMINPSYSGLYNSFMINANSRLQWTGLEGNPYSNFLTVTSSLVEKKVGGGLLISQDNIGITSTTEMALMGAYRIETSRSTFSFGLQGGFVNVKQNYNDLTLRYQDDPDFPAGKQSVMKPNFGAGVTWMTDRVFIGISVPRLLNVKFEDGLTTNALYKRHYYASGAFIRDLTPMMKLKPVALLRYVEGAPLSYEIGANVLWNHKFWFGAYTRNLTTQGALFQLLVNQTVRLGYALEVPTAKNIKTRFITHELVVGIDLSLFRDQEAFLRYF
jgi:type IX secretion system PorP/SprF family membrane protein